MEIKFKGVFKSGKKVYFSNYDITKERMVCDDNFSWYPYTGFKDKNGNEVYLLVTPLRTYPQSYALTIIDNCIQEIELIKQEIIENDNK